jgi:two-component sensor histidine kinase
MKIRVPDYYDEFKCIADKCTDTCCAGWQVDVDDKSFAYYKTIKGEFGDRLHSVMVEGKHGEEGQFRIREDGRCPFLNDNMFCDLYTALGEDALCVTCDKYPRYTTEYGNLRETGIAISCITAAGIVLRKRQNFGFKEWEDKEAFPSLNNIDGELFMALMRARTKAFEIIHDNSSADIFQRISVLAYYATDLQKNIKKESGIDNVISRYSEEYINDILAATGSEDIGRFANEIYTNANRLLTLINDIINLSELDRGAPLEYEDVDISEIAGNCVSMLDFHAKENQVTLHFDGEKTIVRGNKNKLEEVVYNLCDNAIRYNKAGGEVWVTVKNTPEGKILSVRDNGIGISKENQKRIFERFYRVDKSRSKKTGGTGLGLAIVKHIIEQHNFNIEVISDENTGTTINVIMK